MSEQPQSHPTLVAFRIRDEPSMPIVPAPSTRQWMDNTRDRFAYRCLPLPIANQGGWLLANTHKIQAFWDGTEDFGSVHIRCLDGPPNVACPAMSHFGHGILTFSINYLFRTPPGYNLWARGPANLPKDGIAPLEGIIETDWSVATFTMNWKFTAANLIVSFDIGEPICMIHPVRRGEIESFQPSHRRLASEPALQAEYDAWLRSRTEFLEQLRVPGSPALQQKWQKDYVRGTSPGGAAAPEHQTRLTLREFEPGPRDQSE
jgi:hypothetical protein